MNRQKTPGGDKFAMPGLPSDSRRASHDADIANDHSSTFQALRDGLADSQGRRYTDFLRTLRPDFGRVRRDLAFGYCLLIASAVLTVALGSAGAPPVLTTMAGALLIGYWIAYIQLFIHEGAHYNLTAARAHNDRLCNLLIGWMIGTSVAQYRIVHFQHHRALGTTNDSEMTYFFPLNLGFVVKTLLGLRAFEVILMRYRLVARAKAQTQSAATKTDSGRKRQGMMIAGLAMHGAITFGLYAIGGIAPALAWLLGVGMVFPFFGALRQLLEHRREDARADIDYRIIDHGAFTRLFGDDALSASFGGAGFNRHLLHHWEPQLSYTNLPALEQFLLETEMQPIIEARRSTYPATFLRLMTWPFASHIGVPGHNRMAP